MFINRDKEAQPQVESLTQKQKDTVCDLYAAGKTGFEIKAEMMSEFEAGHAFGHLISGAVSKMNHVQDSCTEAMNGEEAPKTLVALKAAMAKIYTTCDVECLDNLIDKIIATTGTWTKYKDSFK